MDINTEINKLITTIQKSLKDKLKERNQYIHNLQWEHHRQLEKYREENKQLKKENEELKEEKMKVIKDAYKCHYDKWKEEQESIVKEEYEEVFLASEERIQELEEQLEQLKKMNQKNYQQVLHYKKQFKLFGESHNLTAEQKVRLEHGILPFA
tara:strand:+ start:49 stop:507 length:459 start_codon:yes stop_codon:yes gene_type:complete